MTIPYQLDFTGDYAIRRGAKWGPITVNYQDANGDPINLTGYSVLAEARTRPKLEPVFAFDLEPAITDAAGGVVTFGDFTDAETRVLPLGTFGWDILLVTPEGVRLPPEFTGAISVVALNTFPAAS